MGASVWAELLRCSPFTVNGIEGPCTVTEVDGSLEMRDRHGALVKRTTRDEFADLEAEFEKTVERMRENMNRLASNTWPRLPP